MDISEREDCRRRLEQVVRVVGQEILLFKGSVEDIGDPMGRGHETSSVDESARKTMMSVLESEFSDRPITLQFEHNPREVRGRTTTSKPAIHFVIDEIDGTTNLKRWAASSREYQPHSAICVAACSSTGLDSLEVGAVFSLDEKETYSGIKLDSTFGRFSAYRNGIPLVIHPVKRGDTKNRLLVIGYTSKVRGPKAKIEESLYLMKDSCVYDGCRSSTMDLINIVRNQYDAYVDPRAVFGKKSETRLETYDVAAILPTMYACNLEVSDIYGRPLTEYEWKDPLPLLVARPEVYRGILARLNDSVKQRVIPTHEQWRVMLRTRRQKAEKSGKWPTEAPTRRQPKR